MNFSEPLVFFLILYFGGFIGYHLIEKRLKRIEYLLKKLHGPTERLESELQSAELQK